MASRSEPLHSDNETAIPREPAHYLLAFAIGTLVGIGVANTWLPQRRRTRLPGIVRRRYRRVRKAGSNTLQELRDARREVTGEFREELGATLEAARAELADMAREQFEGLRDAVRREQRKGRR